MFLGLSNDFFYLQYNLPGEFYTFFLIFLYGKQALYFIAIPVGAAHTRPLEEDWDFLAII